MRAGLVWYHVIWNTHGSWLPGDTRGFRNRDHRIHSSGDYKTPPPPDEHDGLRRYNEARTGPAVRVPSPLRPVLAEGVLDALDRRACEAAALAVGADHVHLLAALPNDYEEAREIVGKVKTVSSLAVRTEMPGTVWSRGCTLKRVVGTEQWDATFQYISQKQSPDAWVWVATQGEESAASAVASAKESAIHDAAAEAADYASAHRDPNHFTQSDAIEVRRVTNRGKGGRAVLARRDIAEGELIERVPVLLIPRTQVFGPGEIAGRAARISWYVFEWLPTKRGYVALSLGYGSIYNHSDTPNAAYDMELPDIMLFTATRAIAAGEEVLISYAGAAGVMKALGFEATAAPPQAVGGDSPAEDDTDERAER